MFSSPLQVALGDRYELQAEVGRGGMAVVYAARDVRHQRRVALKVLTAEESATRSVERFQQEIRIAAGLVHPHIMPVFDSGEAAGLLYYVMPLVEGESLRDRLHKEGRLPVEDAVRLAREVAEALDCAHRAGVTHRDVKPENIMIAHGHALLADFGIARQAIPGAAGLTAVGTFIGTPEYMSPELLLGDTSPGPWSDLYALGCVVYEMLTGQVPHAGVNAQALLAQRLTQAVPRVRDRRPELSATLEAAITRALAAQPNDRHVTAAAFAVALGAATGSASEGPHVSLVVRPYQAVGDDAELDFFGDGITEEVIGDLSKVRALRVISRTSAMRLKGTEMDVRTIGREYGVRYVVTGSVRRAGAKVRVATEIVDAILDTAIWSGKFDGTWDDPFSLQELVAQGIVEALHVTVTEEERQRILTRPISDPRAFDCHRRASAEIARFTREGLERAEALLEEGTAIVGDNAVLCASKGMLHWQYVNAGFDTSAPRRALAREWLERSLTLDPELPDALVGLAWIESGGDKLHAGLARLETALRIDRNNIMGLSLAAVFAWVLGRYDRLRVLGERLRAIDPFDLWGMVTAGAAAAINGDREGRDRMLTRALEMSGAPIVLFVHGMICAQDGEVEAAAKLWERGQSLPGGGMFGAFCRAGVAASRGASAAVEEFTGAAEFADLLKDSQYAWHVGEVLALAGLADPALTALESAVRSGFSNVQMLEGRDYTLRSLHGHPRYEAILLEARRLDRELDALYGPE